LGAHHYHRRRHKVGRCGGKGAVGLAGCARSNQKQRNNGAGRRPGVCAVFRVPSRLMAAHCPVSPGPNVSIAGEAAPMTTVAEAVVCPLRSTATWEWAFPATLAGQSP